MKAVQMPACVYASAREKMEIKNYQLPDCVEATHGGGIRGYVILLAAGRTLERLGPIVRARLGGFGDLRGFDGTR